MTKTKTAPKPVVAGAGYKELGVGNYEISRIIIESNFRKHFDEKRIAELAENIGKVGVLQPVILREPSVIGNPKEAAANRLILVAGERRYRAAKLAGLKEIPARILELTAEEALEVQALENLQRRDLTPLEEARAFKALLDAKGHTLEQVQELADRVDKSVNYVYRAVRLLELPDKMQARIEAGELTPAHGHQLLRLPPEARKEALNEINWTQPATEIADDINRQMSKDLAKCVFPMDKPYGGAGPCTTCSFNTGNQQMLFSGVEKGRCTNAACFEKKEAGAVEAFRQQKAPEFEGFKFLGVKSGDRECNLGGKVLKSEALKSKAVKDDMKRIPGSFAWAVINCTNSYGESRRGMYARFVCMNTKSLSPAAKKLMDPYSGGCGDRTPSTTPKQKHVRMETYHALFEAARLTCAKGLKNEHYTAIAKQLQPGQVNPKIPMEMLNVKDKKGQYAWEHNYAYDLLTGDQLRDLALLLALNNRCSTGQDPDPIIFDAVGVNTKIVMAEAKKKAESEWEAKKGAKKAKPAGAKK